MTTKQYTEAKSLIKNLCCNLDRRNRTCLLLSCDDYVDCPQLTAQSLICCYFRDVLLEDPDAKGLKAEIFSIKNYKTCARCGKHFRAVSNRAKYCASCSKDMERLRKARWAQKYRSHVDV